MIQKFKPDKIEKGLTGIIVLSHGPMAVGMLDSAAVILGNEVKNSAAFCLEANDDPEKYWGRQCRMRLSRFRMTV